MAESAVSFLMQYLGPLLVDEAQSLKGVDGEVRELRNELESIISFLKDADARQDTDEGLKTWVKQLREVAYDVEDILDEFLLSQAQEQHDAQGCIDFLHRLIKQFMARHQTATSIRDMKTRIRTITDRKDAYALNRMEQTSSSNNMNDPWQDRRMDALFVEEADLVGIDRPRNRLIKWLVKGDSKLSAISVVGMGGLGKTTLVKKVYDSQEVKKRFETCAWTTVSQSFKGEDLLRSMIKQFFEAKEDPSPHGVHAMNIVDLFQVLRGYLQNKRYLLVIDDVWDSHALNFLRKALPASEYGSRVMITTRKGDVASSSCMSPSDHIYNLQPLRRRNAWSLFCKKAFHPNEKNSCPPELEELSRSFVHKCHGLPLAIVALGSLLSIKDKTYVEWEMIHRSLGSEIESDDNLRSMKNILLLSFNDLPYYLKSCFLYMSIFPEDCAINRMKLILLWMAEGFIERKEGRSMEEVAEGYLNALITRNLVLVAKQSSWGEVMTCRLHDIVREFVISKFREEHFFASSVEENVTLCNRIRHLAIYSGGENFPKSDTFSRLRSLFIFEVGRLCTGPAIKSLASSRLLKVVDLKNVSMEIFPDDLTNLLHLRYRSLKNTKIKKLPNSLGKLKNLETLNLAGTFVSELPAEILKLERLRHLLGYRHSTNGSYRPRPFNSTDGIKVPAGMGSMRSLQRLLYIEAESCIITEFGKLTQLRTLVITKLRTEDGKDLCTSIEKMNHLQYFKVSSMDEDGVLDLHSISHPPLTLRRLCLRGRLEKLPEWIASLHNLVEVALEWSRLRDNPLEALQSLPNLVELKLRRAYDGEELCCEGRGYPRLKQLWLRELSELKKVRVEKGALSRLERLDIGRCNELVEAPLWLEHLTNLKELRLYDMSDAFLKGLRKDGAEELVDSIQHIPLILYEDTQLNTVGTCHDLGEHTLRLKQLPAAIPTQRPDGLLFQNS